MPEKEEKYSNEDKSIAGTQIINLHLSDIFKNIQDYTSIKKAEIKKGLIAKIIKKGSEIAEKDQMIKIKLNGSYCKYFRIGADEFTQNDAAFKAGDVELGTLDERGVFIFSSGTTAPVISSYDSEGEDSGEENTEASQKTTDKILVLLKDGETGRVVNYTSLEATDKILVLLKDGETGGVMEEENVDMNTGLRPQDNFRKDGKFATEKEDKATRKRTAKAASKLGWDNLVDKKNSPEGKLAKTFEEQWNDNRINKKTTKPDKIKLERWEKFVKLRTNKKWKELLTFIDEQLKIQKARNEENKQIVKVKQTAAKKRLLNENQRVLDALVRTKLNENTSDDDVFLKRVKGRMGGGNEEWIKLQMDAEERANKIRQEQEQQLTKKKKAPKKQQTQQQKLQQQQKKLPTTSLQKPRPPPKQQKKKKSAATETNIKKQKIINYIVLVWIRWINNKDIDLTKHTILDVTNDLGPDDAHPLDYYIDTQKPTRKRTLSWIFRVFKEQVFAGSKKNKIKKNKFTESENLNIFSGKKKFKEEWDNIGSTKKSNISTAIAYILFDTYDIPENEMKNFDRLQKIFYKIWNEINKDIYTNEAKQLFAKGNMYTNVKKWFDFKIDIAKADKSGKWYQGNAAVKVQDYKNVFYPEI